MEALNDSNLDACVIITNKTETNRDYIELLYESKKRTGGDEIKEIYYDSLLKFFLVNYVHNSTVESVLKLGDVTYGDQTYQSYQIDKSRIILENVDANLQIDVLNIYVDHLLQDIENCEFKLEILKPGCLLISCNKSIDFDSFKKRHYRHGKLQNKPIKYHYLPLLEKNKHLDRSDIFNYFSQIVNEQNHVSIQNNEATSSQIIDDNSPQTSVSREIFFKDKIKSLERKLRLYENLNENLSHINKLSEQAIQLNQPERSQILGFGNSILLSNSDNVTLSTIPRETNKFLVTNPKEDKILFQNGNIKVNKVTNLDSSLNENQSDYHRSNLIRVRDSFQKYLIEENRRYEQETDSIRPKSPKNTRPKQNKNRFIQPSTSSCSFSPILKAKACQNVTLINRFPVIKYQKPKNEDFFNPDADTGENFMNSETCLNVNVKCSICLEYLVQNEDVRILGCFHQFHVKCIDTWLAQKSTCPTCKMDLNNFCND